VHLHYALTIDKPSPLPLCDWRHRFVTIDFIALRSYNGIIMLFYLLKIIRLS